jgi:hypothetical protein
MDIVIIEIDLGKNSCSLAGMDALGRVVLRRRMRRSSLESFAKGLGRCMIAGGVLRRQAALATCPEGAVRICGSQARPKGLTC